LSEREYAGTCVASRLSGLSAVFDVKVVGHFGNDVAIHQGSTPFGTAPRNTGHRLHRVEEIAQCSCHFGRILIDEEVAAGKGCSFRIAEALAPFFGDIEELGHLPPGAVENKRRAL